MSIRPSLSSFHQLLVIAGGLTCASALTIALTIWWLHSDAIADASKDSNNLATVLSHQIDNSVQSIDVVLNEVKSQKQFSATQFQGNIEDELSSHETNRFLKERLSHLQQAEFIGLVGADGRLLNSTQ